MSFGCLFHFSVTFFYSLSISNTTSHISLHSFLIVQRTGTHLQCTVRFKQNKNDNKTKSAVTKRRRTFKMRKKRSKNVIVLVHGSLIAIPLLHGFFLLNTNDPFALHNTTCFILYSFAVLIFLLLLVIVTAAAIVIVFSAVVYFSFSLSLLLLVCVMQCPPVTTKHQPFAQTTNTFAPPYIPYVPIIIYFKWKLTESPRKDYGK